MKKNGLLLIWMACPGMATVVSFAETRTVAAMVGRNIRAAPDLDRIICLGPGALRLIVYLKAENKVVDVEDMGNMTASIADEIQQILGIPVIVLSDGALATFDEAVYDAL